MNEIFFAVFSPCWIGYGHLNRCVKSFGCCMNQQRKSWTYSQKFFFERMPGWNQYQMDSQNRCNVICSLWFNLNVSHCIGSIRNYFRFLQPTPASPGCRPGCLAAEYNFFKVLEGVLETEWSNSNRGIEEERVEEEIEKWEEEEKGSWTRWKKQLYTNDRLP